MINARRKKPPDKPKELSRFEVNANKIRYCVPTRANSTMFREVLRHGASKMKITFKSNRKVGNRSLIVY